MREEDGEYRPTIKELPAADRPRERLLLVGGSPEGRGVVTSASYETRKYGVRSGMPMAQAMRLCPAAVRAPVPRRQCVLKSREIRSVLDRFSPTVEPASIDEFYIDLTGTERLYPDTLEATAHRIRQAVLDETGIAISIGGGTSRLVAKMAARKAKPSENAAGVHIVPAGEEASFLAQHDLRDIPGIGPRFQERLARYNLVTVKDALEVPEAVLMERFGKRAGRALYRRIRGIDHAEFNRRPKSRSISREETFPKNLTSIEDLARELLKLSSRAAHDLRRKGLLARTVSVKLRDANFKTRQASLTLGDPVRTDRPIIETARTLLERLFRKGGPGYRLVGISLSDLKPPQDQQLALIEDGTGMEGRRDHLLADAVDRIEERFGKRHIRRAGELGE